MGDGRGTYTAPDRACDNPETTANSEYMQYIFNRARSIQQYATSRRTKRNETNKKKTKASEANIQGLHVVLWHSHCIDETTTMLWFALPTLCLLHKIYTVNCCHIQNYFMHFWAKFISLSIFLGRTQLAPKSGAHMPYCVSYMNSSHHIGEHCRTYDSRLHFDTIEAGRQRRHRESYLILFALKGMARIKSGTGNATMPDAQCDGIVDRHKTISHIVTHIAQVWQPLAVLARTVAPLIVLIAAARLCARACILKLKRRSRRGIRRRRRDRDSFHFYNFPVLIFWLTVNCKFNNDETPMLNRANNDEYIKYKEQKCEPKERNSK